MSDAIACKTAPASAQAIAQATLDGFNHHYALFRDCASTAKRHFEAANWLAMPFQVVLLIPFLRFGQWLFPGHSITLDRGKIVAQIAAAPGNALLQMGGLFGHGLLAWLLIAAPVSLLLTALLTPLLHRVSNRVAALAD